MKRFNPRREEGSALMFALLALVFLTIIGLSLAVVTETEMMIGTNDRVSRETFYAAEAGIGAAISRLMVTNSLEGDYFFIPVKDGDTDMTLGTKTLGYVVDFTAMYPVAWDFAPWTKADAESDYLSVFYRMEIRARRMAWDTLDQGPDCASQIDPGLTPSSSSGDNPFDLIQAEKRLSLGFFVSPVSLEIFPPERPDRFGCSAPEDDNSYVQDGSYGQDDNSYGA